MRIKSVFTFILLAFTAQAAPQGKEACYTLQSSDFSQVTRQIPRQVCFDRLYIEQEDQLVLASSKTQPHLVTDLSLIHIARSSGAAYAFEAQSSLLEVALDNCEKKESIVLVIKGSANELGETNPLHFQVAIQHKLEDNLCDGKVHSLSKVYKYVLK